MKSFDDGMLVESRAWSLILRRLLSSRDENVPQAVIHSSRSLRALTYIAYLTYIYFWHVIA